MKTTRLLTDEASQAIRNQAAESLAILLQQGWIGSGDGYAVEFYPGDVQRLERLRELTRRAAEALAGELPPAG